MKNIFLILAKDNYPDPNIITNIVPQGLTYIAGVLQNAGYSVFGLNPNYIPMDVDVKCSLSAIIKQKIEESSCDYIGVGGLSAEYLFIRDTLRDINPNIPIILDGGGLYLAMQSIFLKTSIIRQDLWSKL
jgi:hypothetical protein